METEDIEPAVSSQAPATAAPIRPLVTGDDETMEQERPESKRQRTVASLLVCSLLTPVDDIPVSYVATHEIDDRPVHDHKTGEQLSPHLVKVGRQTEHDAMTRHQLFERVPIARARGKKVRCQRLVEMKEGANGPFVCSPLGRADCDVSAAWRRRSGIHVANETSDVWDETSIASLPGAHERSSQRSRICSTQGMSPSLSLS